MKNSEVIPSFMLMAIQGNQAVVYVYEIVDGKQKVSQTKFEKNGSEVIKAEEKKQIIEEKKTEPIPVVEEKSKTEPGTIENQPAAKSE